MAVHQIASVVHCVMTAFTFGLCGYVKSCRNSGLGLGQRLGHSDRVYG